ncbi:hypothetical protein [Metabacillus fastidiosus]|uniref:hypothetical protein n=1 Tax=Metabacillus fastidiosus TaxID=1458 RepID=UPI002E1E9718|nr:hypothetical protein [Metabacillus fastidiosus]
MKLQKLFFIIMIISLFVVSGCMSEMENEEQKIKVQKRIGNENKYEDFKEITNDEDVQKVKKILNEANWKNEKAEMVSPPDYQFIFQFKNSEIEAKAVLYRLWMNPNKEKAEIIEGTDRYVQLNKEDSASLFEIFTGEELSPLNQ